MGGGIKKEGRGGGGGGGGGKEGRKEKEGRGEGGWEAPEFNVFFLGCPSLDDRVIRI